MKYFVRAAILCFLSGISPLTHAAATYQTGHISNVTFAGDSVWIMLDSGVPSNCSGTPYGWMIIPATYKPMTAFVIGLWMRGDAASVGVTVYTDGLNSAGWCTINQLDPVN